MRMGVRGASRYIALVLLVAGCPPTNLLRATTTYATASEVATADLGQTGGIMTSICHERAELEYVTDQLHEIGQAPSFADFYSNSPHQIPGLEGTTATWQDQCAAYRAVDQRFGKLLHAVGAYGVALGAFASDNADAGTSVAAIVKSVGIDVGTELPAAAPYKSELSGAGDPIGRVATALQQRWKAKHLGELVAKTDPDLQLVLDHLDKYIAAVRKREVTDTREAIDDLVTALRATVSVGSDTPSRTIALGQQLTAATLEVDLGGRLATFDRRLATLSKVLADLRAAHATLSRGWQAGEGDAKATVRDITELTRELRADVRAFEDPVIGAGS